MKESLAQEEFSLGVVSRQKRMQTVHNSVNMAKKVAESLQLNLSLTVGQPF